MYERLISDDRALDAFMRDIVSIDWHQQHDEGHALAETSAELARRHPRQAELIALWGPRFNEGLTDEVPGVVPIVAELDAAEVPQFAITNFSHEFFPPFRATRPDLFDRFRDIVVSGEERLMKPDPAIFRLALDRFGLMPGEAVFIDDNAANVAAASALGLHAILFTGAAALRTELSRLKLL